MVGMVGMEWLGHDCKTHMASITLEHVTYLLHLRIKLWNLSLFPPFDATGNLRRFDLVTQGFVS